MPITGSNLVQVIHTSVSLSPSSIIWYWPRSVIPAAVKVTMGLVKSNGSLVHDSVTCRPTT